MNFIIIIIIILYGLPLCLIYSIIVEVNVTRETDPHFVRQNKDAISTFPMLKKLSRANRQKDKEEKRRSSPSVSAGT